ncbi:MAG: hypothetical protein A2151_02305 [Candidatus Muproteobacteria bacterium RBG_16_65_34]|uniref:histidine kinase n=1 Tax=Candidatus Muproteobacteria bacterium RBG_16_65_34 TaxID=1817760 RepID=A0A1F6TUS7_9PROT|nr:MAG: hypothetical protein A2151_02305 [Candidatus Muproteobacteria bacterium RBG_16_65_34]
MRSMQSRLGAGLLVSLAAVFALQGFMVSFALRYLAESGVVTHLEHDMMNLVTGISVDDSGQVQIAEEQIGQVYQLVFSGSYFRITSGPQVLHSRSLWDADLPAIDMAASAFDQRRVTGPLGQSLLMITRAFRISGHSVIVSMTGDLQPLEADLRRFELRYTLVSAAAYALLLLLQVFIVRTGLKPLQRIREEIGRLERGQIERLSDETPRELKPLVAELNRLLATLAQRLTRSRRALGNLAHAMKTPLTLLTELAERSEVRALPEAHQTLAVQTDSLNRLIDRELARARVAGGANPGQRFDFDSELPALFGTLKSLYRDKPLEIEYRADPHTAFTADREDMIELLGNLLDNACKWAKSKVLFEAAVTSTRHSPFAGEEWGEGSNEILVISIADDGPGCPPDAQPRLAQRGVRLDEATPGHGLGLAIAWDIVAGYGGRMEFGSSPTLGGFLVSVALPAHGGLPG